MINVTNSFGISFKEDEKDGKTWFLDHIYIEEMYEMLKKMNGKSFSTLNTKGWIGRCILARERIIGWYYTRLKLYTSDQEINDLFKWFIAKPVMVIVDVWPNTIGILIDVYLAIEIKDMSLYYYSISGCFF